jgi:hypothetical protein
MPITRTPIIDDSGLNQDGTVFENAWKQEFYDQIDAALASVSAAPWVAVPFAAGNFSAPLGTWTVASGNVVINRYCRLGYTLIWTLRLQNTVLSAAPGWLYLAPPVAPSPIAGNGQVRLARALQGTTQYPSAYAEFDAGSGLLLIAPDATGASFASGSAFAIAFTILLEIP